MGKAVKAMVVSFYRTFKVSTDCIPMHGNTHTHAQTQKCPHKVTHGDTFPYTYPAYTQTVALSKVISALYSW